MMQSAFAPRLIEEETASMPWQAARALVDEPAWSFIGDPIDGTASFAADLTGWGTMIGACHRGWPRVGAALLPCWGEPRFAVDDDPTPPRGLLLAATPGKASWAMTEGGLAGALRDLLAPARRSGHVGWNAVAARHYTLDYTRGIFPLCEGGWIADVAALAAGRMEATLFNHKLWDLAPTWPVLRALGFDLFRWPDLAGAAGEHRRHVRRRLRVPSRPLDRGTRSGDGGAPRRGGRARDLTWPGCRSASNGMRDGRCCVREARGRHRPLSNFHRFVPNGGQSFQ